MNAIICFSGGLDSTLLIALAKEQGHKVIALSFDYGQRHKQELDAARAIAKYYGVIHKILKIDPQVTHSSALLGTKEVPKGRSLEEIEKGTIPPTYVPARNSLFIIHALAMAECEGANEIHLGSNIMDHAPYPDCRPEYFQAFQQLIDLATKVSVEGSPPQLITPLLNMDKNEIVKEARRLAVPIDMTFSCYSPENDAPCGLCDACFLRKAALTQLDLL